MVISYNSQGQPMTRGDRVRALREARGLSQAALGKLLGVSQGAISQIEKNLSKCFNGENLLLFCAVVGASPDYVLYGKGEQQVSPSNQEEIVKLLAGLDDSKIGLLKSLIETLLKQEKKD